MTSGAIEAHRIAGLRTRIRAVYGTWNRMSPAPVIAGANTGQVVLLLHVPGFLQVAVFRSGPLARRQRRLVRRRHGKPSEAEAPRRGLPHQQGWQISAVNAVGRSAGSGILYSSRILAFRQRSMLRYVSGTI